MIKGQVFANQLFENQIFALFINTFTDGANGVSDNYKNGMAITYSGSDLTIDSGACVIQGRYLEEDTSTTISAGADNMYCKLVIEIDLDKTNTTTEFNQAYYKIVKGANDYPALTQTNIVKNVSGVYQYELARFRNPSSGITDFQDRRTFIDFTSIYDIIEQHIQDIDDGALFVLKSGTASLSGAVTGSASFDSSSNLSIATTIPTNTQTFTFTETEGTATMTLYRNGNVVQVNWSVTINQGKTGIQTFPAITMPDWAKVGRTSVDGQILVAGTRMTPSTLTGSTNIVNTTADGGFSLVKLVNGTYRAGFNILTSTNDTSSSSKTYGGTSTYVVN